MTDMVEKVARAIYEADDVWSAAFPWPDMPPTREQSADEYRRVARAAIEAMREPTEEQLDAVRHLMMWLDFDRPTEAALLDHCRRLGKEPPKECRDIDHVPPKALRTFWLYRSMIDTALKPSESLSTEKG